MARPKPKNEDKRAMKSHPWDEVERRYLTADEIAGNKRWALLELDGADLAELRQVAGLSQAALGERVGVTQVEVGRAEKRADVQLSTLRRYIEAMGGQLQLVARFGERSVPLKVGVTDKPETSAAHDVIARFNAAQRRKAR